MPTTGPPGDTEWTKMQLEMHLPTINFIEKWRLAVRSRDMEQLAGLTDDELSSALGGLDVMVDNAVRMWPEMLAAGRATHHGLPEVFRTDVEIVTVIYGGARYVFGIRQHEDGPRMCSAYRYGEAV